MNKFLEALLAPPQLPAKYDEKLPAEYASQPIDDGGFTRNVLMKGIPGQEDQSPSFNAIGGNAMVNPNNIMKPNDLVSSPTALDLQGIMNPKGPVEPKQQIDADEFKEESQDVAKDLAQKQSKPLDNIVPQAPTAPAAPKEPSALDKLLTAYNQPEAEDTELKAALDRRAETERNLAMLKAFNQIGSAIGRTKYDPNLLSDQQKLAGQEVENLQTLRKSAKEKKAEKREEIKFAIDTEKARNQMNDEDAKRDKDSEISKMTRAAIADMLGRIGRTDQAKQVMNSTLSSKQLDDTFGQLNIQNYISMYEAQQSRLEQAKITAQARKEAKEDKEKASKDAQISQLTTHISDKIKQFDDKIGYNKALTDYDMLSARLASGKFDSVSDLTATYALMKAMDPGSVVRETEFDNLVKTQGGLNKIRQMPDRFFKGNIYSPEFRKKLLDQFSGVVDARRRQLKKVLEPDLKRAKDLGINEEYIISPSTSKSFSDVDSSDIAGSAQAELAKRRQGK